MRPEFLRAVLLPLLVGCSTGSTAPGTEFDGLTAGGCECSDETGQQAAISLACLCAEFPGSCPTYEHVTSPEAQPPFRSCWDDSRWWVTEQRGCGKVIVSNGPSLGGFQLVYDEATLGLIGAAVFGDVPFGSCGSHAYTAGASASCDEGTVCSRCDGTCAPACSISVVQNTWGLPTFADETSGYDCAGIKPGSSCRSFALAAARRAWLPCSGSALTTPKRTSRWR